MNPAPTAHHHPDRERRIPSGLEAGAAFALGTAAPMHYASPLLATIATATLYLTGDLMRRWPALPTVARPPAGRTAWLCAIFCLGWLSAVRAPGRETGAAEPGEKDALAETGKPIAGTIRGVVANLPVLRRALFSHHPDRLKYADFQLEETESGRVFRVMAEISGTKLPTGLEPGALVKVQGKIYPRPAVREIPRKRPATTVIRVLPGGLSIRPGPPPSPGLRLRWRVLELINRMYSDREQGLFCALIVGEKRLLDQELRLHFIETGTAHFLAISGLHVGLVMLLAMRIPFPRKGKTALRLLVLLDDLAQRYERLHPTCCVSSVVEEQDLVLHRRPRLQPLHVSLPILRQPWQLRAVLRREVLLVRLAVAVRSPDRYRPHIALPARQHLRHRVAPSTEPCP